MKSPRIDAIEFTLFEVSIPNIAADPSGFGVWYEPGIVTTQKRFGVRIFTDEGVVGEYVPPRSRARRRHRARYTTLVPTHHAASCTLRE